MKTVKVHTLKQGDHFMFSCDAKLAHLMPVYVVNNIDKDGYCECVCIQSGKDFVMGRNVCVVPVKVNLSVEVINND